jgi:hypothetical protein
VDMNGTSNGAPVAGGGSGRVPDGSEPRDNFAAFVSARLVDDEDAQVGAVAFDPNHHGDELGDGRIVTGWEVFVGDESEDELSDPDLVRLPSLSWLIDRFPQLEPLFDTHDGSLASWVADGDGALVPWDGDDVPSED